ncbi:unnamed protein product [Didymodactylos carnosus]|uniref:Ribosomal RNA small subunit methyltransferase H n=1 Tax=Didymodactylos carnosus TaxID=1234261 RepID=A0A813TVT5_9BILA|nr:unnamed protein product [Didymodactylos carnosus]CAF0874692.1 unnamed protein product [Didymodactylos carnosus]CAF3600874.1 unnamed protein product [Didymodactylos carnosus]CAF3659258.1 unnamed protein product [Didymodactylos carnosus]
MTFGAGGHTRGLLEKNSNSIVYSLDQDSLAFNLANELKQKSYPTRLIPLHGCFSDVKNILKQKYNITGNYFDGILFDVGMSSMQLSAAERGFSLIKEGPLDMRMNINNKKTVTAYDLVNKLDEVSLGRILRLYGEETRYKKIAGCICQWRNTFGKITTTTQLAEVIKICLGGTPEYDKLNRSVHVATKTFQALRIVVNDELNEFLLKQGGHLVAISFHSLEDRIVKRHFQGIVLKPDMFIFNLDETQLANEANQENRYRYHKKIIEADEEEININPRSRSAKMRYGIKL